jgi:hypothetical protein
VLTTPKLKAPLSKQYLKAKMVSAVSPDCDTKMATSSLKTGVFRSRKSDAKVHDTHRFSYLCEMLIRLIPRALTQLDSDWNLSELLEDRSDLS